MKSFASSLTAPESQNISLLGLLAKIKCRVAEQGLCLFLQNRNTVSPPRPHLNPDGGASVGSIALLWAAEPAADLLIRKILFERLLRVKHCAGQDTATADFPESNLERGPETPSILIMQMII